MFIPKRTTATSTSSTATARAKRIGKIISEAVAAVAPNGERTSRSYVPATSSCRTPMGMLSEERTMPKTTIPTTANAKYSPGERKGGTRTSFEMK